MLIYDIHEYLLFLLLHMYTYLHIGLRYMYPVSFRGDIAELLLRVSLNGRYALMIQLISPAGANRPRTMTKI